LAIPHIPERYSTLSGGKTMLNWAAAFFAIAFLGGFLRLSGIAAAAVIHIAWILFAAGLVLALGFLVMGRRVPSP
jgi:uncharacterized membrane protein YtjA (UPF0391 family)